MLPSPCTAVTVPCSAPPVGPQQPFLDVRSSVTRSPSMMLQPGIGALTHNAALTTKQRLHAGQCGGAQAAAHIGSMPSLSRVAVISSRSVMRLTTASSRQALKAAERTVHGGRPRVALHREGAA